MLLFTARRIDTETFAATPEGWGLYYYRARVYHPALGRFMQTDPIGYYDGMNLYQYCGNNPTNYIDPTGTDRYIVTDSVFLHRSIAVDQYVERNGQMVVSGQRKYSIEAVDYSWAWWKTEGKWQKNGSVNNQMSILIRDRIAHRVKSTYEEDMILQQVLDEEMKEKAVYGIAANLGEATWCVPYSYGRLYVGMSPSSIAKAIALAIIKGETTILNLFMDNTTPVGTTSSTDSGTTKCKPEMSQ